MTDPETSVLLELPWRTGMHLGRTIYAVLGPEPSKDDILIGMMDSQQVAQLIVDDHNAALVPALSGP